ncbi:MAG TPA: hypothetical protein DCZ23_07155 [Lachnospiraceae bacterium]|nr:hypothetical protein [Lachnospiraceae bacterium]
MKKKYLITVIVSFMALLLAACGNSSDGQNDRKDTESSIQLDNAQVPSESEDDESKFTGKQMLDFSVTTIQGETFSLSDVLKKKEAVMVNFWATWCHPCESEMPYIQEAYEQYKDKVDIIALSIEPSDTNDVLKKYVKEHNMTFAVANDAETGINPETRLSNIYTEYSIPVTLLVDRFGTIVYYGEGSALSTESFTRLFDAVIGDNYTSSKILKD